MERENEIAKCRMNEQGHRQYCVSVEIRLIKNACTSTILTRKLMLTWTKPGIRIFLSSNWFWFHWTHIIYAVHSTKRITLIVFNLFRISDCSKIQVIFTQNFYHHYR